MELMHIAYAMYHNVLIDCMVELKCANHQFSMGNCADLQTFSQMNPFSK